MAILWYDGFDHYPSAELGSKGAGVYVNYANYNIASTGRTGAGYLSSGGNGTLSCSPPGLSADTMVIGFALRRSVSDLSPVIVQVVGDVVHLDFVWTSSGINCRLGGSTVIGSGVLAWATTSWNYFEAKVTIHDTNGGIWTRINGQDDIRTGLYAVGGAVTQDTRNGGSTGLVGSLTFKGANNVSNHFDDLYILDTTGPAPNNDFLGDVRVETLVPTGAGNYSQWTPSAGSNWENVDDGLTALADTNYNSTLTAGNKDTFVYGNLSVGSGTVYSVASLIGARKDDGGTRTFTSLVRQGGTDYPHSTDEYMSMSYQYERWQYDTNPATGVAWTIDDINTNAEFGYRLES